MRIAHYIGHSIMIALLCGPQLLLPQEAHPSADAGQIYKRISPAVVLIETVDPQGKPLGQGTGFLIGPDGRILTNFHVIKHAKQAIVRLANGDAYDDVQILGIDKRRDIAVLKINAVEAPFVPLGQSSAVEIGTPIYSLGNPLGLQNTISQGIVSGIRQFEGYRYFQITAPISPGSSGGPVIGTRGAVIGIAVGSLEGGQNLNFAIPIDYARGMLQSTRAIRLEDAYEPPPVPGSGNSEVKSAHKPTEEQQRNSDSGPVTSEPLPEVDRRNLAAFLVTKLGQWKYADAIKHLGQPLREYATDGHGSMKKLEYGDPTNTWRGVRLTFELGTDLLIAVSTYPWNMTVAQMRVHFGENFNTFSVEKEGLIGYTYVDRPLLVTANDLGAIDAITTYVQGAMLLPNLGFASAETSSKAPASTPIPAAAPTDSVFDLNSIKAKIGTWAVEDAVRELGQPYRRYTVSAKKRSDDWDVCLFADRTETLRRVQLMFKASSKRLVGITVYPFSTRWSEVTKQLGFKFKVDRHSDGTTEYAYSDKPVSVLVDRSGYVNYLSVHESTTAWQILAGEKSRNDWRIRLAKPIRTIQTTEANIRGQEFAIHRNLKLLLIERSLGRWTAEDARAKFGPAASQEVFGSRANNSDGDKYGFRDIDGHFVVVSLLFYRESNKLVSANLAPAGMTLEQLLTLFGKDFAETTEPSGDRQYWYRDRAVVATIDKMGNVVMLFFSLAL